MTPREPPHARSAYRHFHAIATRWMDNDAYGHVNNVIYYAYFDTVVNAWLIRAGLLDPQRSPVIGMVAETGCRYFSELAFPQTVHAGLRAAHVGNSSVRYEIGIFADRAETAAAQGHFVHVYVDAASRRPTPLPAALREALAGIRA